MPLVVDIAADGYLHMLREGEVEIYFVALPDGAVAVAGVVDGEVKDSITCLVVNYHLFKLFALLFISTSVMRSHNCTLHVTCHYALFLLGHPNSFLKKHG